MVPALPHPASANRWSRVIFVQGSRVQVSGFRFQKSCPPGSTGILPVPPGILPGAGAPERCGAGEKLKFGKLKAEMGEFSVFQGSAFLLSNPGGVRFE